MKISIIIPVYNVSEYIVECLDSVGSQDYQYIECILVDDCGTDDSMLKVSAWIDSYNGNVDFKIIHHDHNKGISEARNTGIREAKGDYLMFVDSDDYLLPNSLQTLCSVIDRHPDIDEVVGNFDCNDAGLVKMWGVKSDYPEITSSRQLIEEYSISSPVVWNKLVRRSLIVDSGLLFNSNVSMAEDLLFTYHLSKVVKSVAYLSASTYFYRIRSGSITTGAERAVVRIHDMIYVLQSIQKSEVDNPNNSIRYHLLKEMKFLLSGRRPYTLKGVWHKFDIFAFGFFLSEMKHFRIKNMLILGLFIPPISKLFAKK